MKYKILIIIILLIFAAGVAGTVFALTASPLNTVRVVSDGKVIYTADLSTAPDTMFDVNIDGHVNTVEIQDGRIRVISADCPDQTCVRLGWLSSPAAPIVCLPHHLVIEFVGDSDIDAVTR